MADSLLFPILKQDTGIERASGRRRIQTRRLKWTVGFTIKIVGEVLQAGADVIVSGSGVFKGDIRENTAKFMEILKQYE